MIPPVGYILHDTHEPQLMHTFLVVGILLEGDVAKVKNGSHDSKQVGLLRGRETDAVHGVSEVRELFLVLETGVMERGWVEVLEVGRGGEGEGGGGEGGRRGRKKEREREKGDKEGKTCVRSRKERGREQRES